MGLQGVDRGLLAWIAVFRWAAWALMATLAVLSRDDLVRPWVATASLGAALAVTAGTTALLRSRPHLLVDPAVVTVELVVGGWLFVADGWAYGGSPMGVAAPPALGSVWTVAGVLAMAVAGGARWGALAGAALGAANAAGTYIAGHPPLSDQALGLASTAASHILAGAGMGYAASRIGSAKREVAETRARDAVALTLHDGVLQTLAIIARRIDTAPDLARLARNQERELREFLFGTAEVVGHGGGDLGSRLRAAAAIYEDRYGGSATVVAVDEDLAAIGASLGVDALAGAVGEALANAGRHGGGGAVTVCAESNEDEVFCSVTDRGPGFDPAAVQEGHGLSRSVRGKLDEVGGRVEIDARVGGGVEVRLWAPRRSVRNGAERNGAERVGA